MIALFCDDLTFATRWADVVFSPMSRFVDGPYRGFEGLLLNKTKGRLYVVQQQADSAYIAARMALRRGATHLAPILRSTLLNNKNKHLILEPVNTIWDLSKLEPVLRTLPDSAKSSNLSPKKHYPASPLWERKGPQGLTLGTPPFEIGNPWLGAILAKELAIDGLDLQASGYAQAVCEEQQVAFSPMTIISSTLTNSGPIPTPSHNWEEQFLDALVPQIEKLLEIGFEPVEQQQED